MKLRPALFLALSLLAPFLNAADRPNIVWIVSEDNSKHYLKLFDENGAEAPHIEALAAEGITFTRAFSNAPVCSVARTTLARRTLVPSLAPSCSAARMWRKNAASFPAVRNPDSTS